MTSQLKYAKSYQSGIFRIVHRLLSAAKILCHTCLITSTCNVTKYVNTTRALNMLSLSGPVTSNQMLIGVSQAILSLLWFQNAVFLEIFSTSLNPMQRWRDTEI